jgi:hypothetical protein
MTFSNSADGRVAGHLAQGVEAVGQQQGLAAHAGGSERGFGAGMTTAYDNNIIFFKDLHDFIATLSGAHDTGKDERAEQSCRFT